MSLWRPRLVESARMKYLGIVEALEAMTPRPRAPGDRLPSQRATAEALNVDLTTVTRAFNEARRRGLVDAQAGRGSFIKSSRRSACLAGGSAPLVDLEHEYPASARGRGSSEGDYKGIGDLLSSSRGMLHLHYQESTGSEPDRAAAAAWLGRRMEMVSPSRILVACGAQSALFAICESQLRSGDAIAAGAMTYPGLKAVAAQKGLAVVPLAMDEGGIIPHAFEEACRANPGPATTLVNDLAVLKTELDDVGKLCIERMTRSRAGTMSSSSKTIPTRPCKPRRSLLCPAWPATSPGTARRSRNARRRLCALLISWPPEMRRP